MKLREKLYCVKVAGDLGVIVNRACKKCSAMDYLAYNSLKSEVARTIFLKGYDMDTYHAFFDKSLDEWVAETLKSKGLE